MIDIHNHILYGIDDGSASIEKSIDMIKKAKQIGITDLILTPHYMEDGYKNDKKDLELKFNLLKKNLEKESVKIGLYLGEEIFVFPELKNSLMDNKVISLNNSRYVLIELPLFEEIDYFEEVIFELCSEGYVPIIAHPERYFSSFKSLDKLESYIERGALLQINANSLVERYGKEPKKVAKMLLKKNMVHFVASDAHSRGGYKMLEESLKVLEKLVGEETFKRITIDNQKCVLEDKEINIKCLDDKKSKINVTRKFSIFSFNRKGA